MVMKIIAWLFVGGALVLAYMCIGVMTGDINDMQREVKTLKTQIDTLRLNVDAHEEMVKQALAEAENLQYKLTALQNAYVVVKRQNENLAHKLIRGESNE